MTKGVAPPANDTVCDRTPVLRLVWRAVMGIFGVNVALVGLALVLGLLLPAGEQIAFESNRDGDSDIYLLDLGRGFAHNLTHNPFADTNPVWSPDGRYLAFASDRRVLWGLYVLEIDSGHLRLLPTTDTVIGRPTWSPDGSQLAYAVATGGNFSVTAIYITALDGGEVRQLIAHPSFRDEAPSWSPDGQHIALMSNRSGNWDIYALYADGSHLRQLTVSPADDMLPVWSPDGSRIAFLSRRNHQDGIYLLGTDCIPAPETCDARARLLLAVQALALAWSPDGQRLAFVSVHEGNAEIYTVDVNGREVRRLTDHPAHEWTLSWRPLG